MLHMHKLQFHILNLSVMVIFYDLGKYGSMF